MTDFEGLEVIFNRFAAFGSRRGQKRQDDCEIDATRVVKLAKDCQVLDKRLTRNQVDLIFHKIKQSNRRKINYDEFVRCTELWARQKGKSHSELVREMVSKDAGPKLNGTVPDAVTFHDDRRMYTGTHKHGGPESVAKGRGHGGGTLADVLDRSPADVRGVPKKSATRNDDARGKRGSHGGPQPSRSSLRHYQFHSDDSIGKQLETKQKDEREAIEINTGREDTEDLKVRVEGIDYIIHPDWEKRLNPRAVGIHDKYYYVNRVTNERTWSIPTVPVQPPGGS